MKKRQTTALAITSLTLLCAAPDAWAQQPVQPSPSPAPPAQAAPMAPQPGYGQAPGYGAPPGYGQAPGYGSPPGYGAPPGYGQPVQAPGYGAPPGYGAAPGYPYPPYLMMGPARLPYKDGEPVPPGYVVETRPYKKLVSAGLGTFLPLYFMSLLLAATYIGEEGPDRNFYTPLFIPVVGPFVTISTSDSESLGTMTLFVDGLAQATGVALFAAGMIAQEKYLERAPKAAFNLRPEVFVGAGTTKLRWRF